MSRGLGMIIYGVVGIGKTHFALYHPGPVLCISCVETGYDDLKYVGDTPTDSMGFNAETFEMLDNQITSCIKNPKTFKTVVIDGLLGLQQLFFDYLIRKSIGQAKLETYQKAEKAFWSYYTGPRMEAPNAIIPFISKLTALLNSNVNVVLIGHKRKDTDFNEAGADIAKAELDMDEGLRSCFLKWAPNVIYMTMQPNIVQSTSTSGQTITAGKSDYGGAKLIYTTTNAQNSAKNKIKLPPVIPIKGSAKETFEEFWKNVHPAYKGGQNAPQ